MPSDGRGQRTRFMRSFFLTTSSPLLLEVIKEKCGVCVRVRDFFYLRPSLYFARPARSLLFSACDGRAAVAVADE